MRRKDAASALPQMNISVVIPTHNRAHCLARAIESALGQSLPPARVIVVDDGSDDGSGELVRAQYPEVELLRQARGGVSSARNRGILAARTEWVALLDSDDAWLPDKLYRQAEMLRRHPDSLLCHTDEIWIRNGRRVNPGRRHAKPAGAIFTHCLPLCCVSPSAVVIHRSVFEAVGLFDPTLPACEDYDLWLRIFCRYPIELVPDKLVIKYGGHADQLSRRFAAMDRFRVRALAGLLQSQVLGEREQQMTQQMLMQKCRILVHGALKRGRLAQAERYRQTLQAGLAAAVAR